MKRHFWPREWPTLVETNPTFDRKRQNFSLKLAGSGNWMLLYGVNIFSSGRTPELSLPNKSLSSIPSTNSDMLMPHALSGSAWLQSAR